MCKCSNRATPWQKQWNYIYQAGSLLLVMTKSFTLFKFQQQCCMVYRFVKQTKFAVISPV